MVRYSTTYIGLRRNVRINQWNPFCIFPFVLIPFNPSAHILRMLLPPARFWTHLRHIKSYISKDSNFKAAWKNVSNGNFRILRMDPQFANCSIIFRRPLFRIYRMLWFIPWYWNYRWNNCKGRMYVKRWNVWNHRYPVKNNYKSD